MRNLNKNNKPVYWSGDYHIEWYGEDERKVKEAHCETSYVEAKQIAIEWLNDCATIHSYTIKRTIENSLYRAHTPKEK